MDVLQPATTPGNEAERAVAGWLAGLGFPQYTPLFTAAGYDLPTIARMTPVTQSCKVLHCNCTPVQGDLGAIGVQLPAHRARLAAGIAGLQVLCCTLLPSVLYRCVGWSRPSQPPAQPRRLAARRGAGRVPGSFLLTLL